MKRIKALFLLLFLCFDVFAVPKEIEVYFLNRDKQANLLNPFLKKYFKSLPIASKEDNCLPYGDGCFHPQYGFIEGKKKKNIVEQEKTKKVELKTFNAIESDMIDCKEGNYFDIFCGKAKKINNRHIDYEIWIDTSSSMREVDFSTSPSFCHRRSFIERMKTKCHLEIKVFDTSIKQYGGLDGLCVTYGLNNQDRLIQWIENSSAKKLLIVTDINEASAKLRDYFFKVGAKLIGADMGNYTGKKLVEHSLDLMKSCKK